MARPGTMYRAHRRNQCRADGGVWPKGGVQLDPVYYRPTAAYAQDSKATTAEMFGAGKRWIKEAVLGRPKI